MARRNVGSRELLSQVLALVEPGIPPTEPTARPSQARSGRLSSRYPRSLPDYLGLVTLWQGDPERAV